MFGYILRCLLVGLCLWVCWYVSAWMSFISYEVVGVYTCLRVCQWVGRCLHVYMCAFFFSKVYLCMHISLWVYILTWIHAFILCKHNYSHTRTHTKHTHAQAQTHINTHTHSYAYALFQMTPFVPQTSCHAHQLTNSICNETMRQNPTAVIGKSMINSHWKFRFLNDLQYFDY